MRYTLFTFLQLLLLVFSASVYGQSVSDIAGNWSGYIETENRELRIEITFSYSDGVLDGTIDIPDRRAFTFPVEVVDINNNQLVFQFETGHGPAVFYGNRNEKTDEITGEFEESGEISSFLLHKHSTTDGNLNDVFGSEITIQTGEEETGGSLVLQNSRSPLVILVSGSGSKERDQNISGFSVFQQLSSSLYNEGYSTFRYDDPGVGESTGNEEVTLREMKSRLVDIIEYLNSQYTSDISGIVLLGHNQGGLVASLAASEVSVDGVILAATPFLPGEEIITGQIKKIAEEQDVPDEIVRQNLAFQDKIYSAVHLDSGWTAIENELSSRLEQQIGELPEKHQNALGDMSAFIQSQVDNQLETAKSRWFKSWIETDPVELIKELDVPTLAIFGEKDTQVPAASNKDVADSLTTADNLNLRIKVIKGANHLFQDSNTGMTMKYGILAQDFTDDFIVEIDCFLDSIQFRNPD